MSETFLTNCPHCKSVFKLRKEHLEMASGHVRCGNCHSLFLATDSLVSMGKEAQKNQMPETLDKANEHILNNVLSELASDEQSASLAEIEQISNSRRLWKWLFYISAFSILSLLAFWYLYLWPNRVQLAQQSSWRPVLESSCAILQCIVPPRQRLDQYQVSAIDVSTNPSGQQQVSMLLKNKANFAQPFPKVRIILSDIKGNQFSTPTYSPAQYLADFNHNVLIEAGQSVQIGFSFTSDDKNYSGYQVELVE